MDGRQGTARRGGAFILSRAALASAAAGSAPLLKAGPASERAAPARYYTLDGMRGIAALAVALFHFDFIRAPHGYLAVDFFYALSGFVLWQAYRHRLDDGIAPARFMKQRLIRLYPLYLLGLVLAVFSLVARYVAADGDLGALKRIWLSLPANLLMIPSPVTAAMYPANLPAWTLLFELVASLAFVLFVARLSRPWLVFMCLASASLYLPKVIEHNSANIGALFHEWPTGVARTAFSFALGLLLARMPGSEKRTKGWAGALCLLATAYALGMFVGFDLGVSIPVKTPEVGYYDVFIVVLIWPILILAGARLEVPDAVARIGHKLGDISFALYAVHWALIEPFRYLFEEAGVNRLIAATCYLACGLVLAWLFTEFYDGPVRRKLAHLAVAK